MSDISHAATFAINKTVHFRVLRSKPERIQNMSHGSGTTVSDCPGNVSYFVVVTGWDTVFRREELIFLKGTKWPKFHKTNYNRFRQKNTQKRRNSDIFSVCNRTRKTDEKRVKKNKIKMKDCSDCMGT
jgi:hypothetical protein